MGLLQVPISVESCLVFLEPDLPILLRSKPSPVTRLKVGIRLGEIWSRSSRNTTG